jgi:hypothetical protein
MRGSSPTGIPTDGVPARPLKLPALWPRAAPSKSTMSSSAPGGARTSISTAWWALCPPCHTQTDAPYVSGRLMVTPLGWGRFTFAITRGPDKWAPRA